MFTFKGKDSALVEKCNRELEIKYTKMLTLEFCVSWIKVHSPSLGQTATLLQSHSNDANRDVTEYRLDIVEKNIRTGDTESLRCCLIFAMDVEPLLKKRLSEGNGGCVFEN